MKEELRIKDRLISKLLDNDESPETLSAAKLSVNTENFPLNNNKATVIFKLKGELDLAYKILSQRDTEINTMKKSAK